MMMATRAMTAAAVAGLQSRPPPQIQARSALRDKSSYHGRQRYNLGSLAARVVAGRLAHVTGGPQFSGAHERDVYG